MSERVTGGRPAKDGRFGREHVALLDEALYVAEHTCADYFKMGGATWRDLRFELNTAAHLRPGERSPEVLARLARYEAVRLTLPGRARRFYRICLQDGHLLRVAGRDRLELPGLLTYVLTHELVHIVRFERFEQLFAADRRERAAEERRVHQLTYDMLKPLRALKGLAPVLERYRVFRPSGGLGGCLPC